MSDEAEVNGPHILLVEDDEALGGEVRRALLAQGYEVTWKRTGAQAEAIDPAHYQLIILDLMLPGTHGFDLLKQYRQISDVPVIILTARKDTFDKVRGFELGGDDYMTKPFWPEELIARVSARLRRPVIQREAGRTIGPILIDAASRRVEVDGEEIDLTRVEFDILAVLAERVGMAMSRRQLVDRVLDADREGTERTLDVHVSRIRKKVGDEAAAHVETVWGVGYRLVEEPKRKG